MEVLALLDYDAAFTLAANDLPGLAPGALRHEGPVGRPRGLGGGRAALGLGRRGPHRPAVRVLDALEVRRLQRQRLPGAGVLGDEDPVALRLAKEGIHKAVATVQLGLGAEVLDPHHRVQHLRLQDAEVVLLEGDVALHTVGDQPNVVAALIFVKADTDAAPPVEFRLLFQLLQPHCLAQDGVADVGGALLVDGAAVPRDLLEELRDDLLHHLIRLFGVEHADAGDILPLEVGLDLVHSGLILGLTRVRADHEEGDAMNGHGDDELAIKVVEEVLLGEEHEDAVHVQEAELPDVVVGVRLVPAHLGQLPEDHLVEVRVEEVVRAGVPPRCQLCRRPSKDSSELWEEGQELVFASGAGADKRQVHLVGLPAEVRPREEGGHPVGDRQVSLRRMLRQHHLQILDL
mmetsp:Transcript_103668/g.302565  ORF Transcript_103668/g.302565 Transcript_103668/m.302565 type:complete len:403 (-) Transcript_103668:139-1347(-)